MSSFEPHFHQWRPGAWGPCEGRVGRYAQCDCGAQVFIGDDDEPAVLFLPPHRDVRASVPREAFTVDLIGCTPPGLAVFDREIMEAALWGQDPGGDPHLCESPEVFSTARRC